MTHIRVGKRIIIGSDNGLSPGLRQTITWTNAGILLIGPLGTNCSEILIKINTLSFKKMLLKMSSRKWWPSCFGLNVLMRVCWLRSVGSVPKDTGIKCSRLFFFCLSYFLWAVRWHMSRFSFDGDWHIRVFHLIIITTSHMCSLGYFLGLGHACSQFTFTLLLRQVITKANI